MYRLNVHKIEQSCLFELTWGQGQRLTTSLPYPVALDQLLTGWQRAYLGYYKQALRGRAGATGQVVRVQMDWHSQLVQAEAKLLSEFYRWLGHGDLQAIRTELLQAQAASMAEQSAPLELFLACTPIDIARLPWETWEFGQRGQIQIVRSPATIQAAVPERRQFRRGRARVLAILGDDTGLNFEGEQRALNALKGQLEVHYVGWQPDEDGLALKQRICREISDPQGWDVLFFAGHSNEEALLEGRIAIAPHTAISVKELNPYLRQAQQRGLQFALFNSCSGLDIAHGLINLGLSQVAIMREPIHNQVAQAFLVEFLQRLARSEDVQTALLNTCRWLRLEKSLTYPSAYLVPSLFRHPESVPYRVQPSGWRAIWQRWQPTRREAIVAGAVALLSLMPSVQEWLLDQRVMVQAMYRDLTAQIAVDAQPPIVVVQIDQQTFQDWGTDTYKPLNRAMLADIVQSLNRLEAGVIGIDYILDLQQPAHDAQLRQALVTGVEQHQLWPVIITYKNPSGEWIRVHPHVADPTWMLQGNAVVPLWRVLPQRQSRHYQPPFSYQLAIAHHLHRAALAGETAVPRPGAAESSLQAEVDDYLSQPDHHPLPPGVTLHPLTHFSYRFRQRWLQPLLDFSIAPTEVYDTVLARELMADPEAILPRLQRESLADAVVIIAAGGYYAAGITRDGEDNFPVPPAIAYWRSQLDIETEGFTGGEAHAYMTQHLLTDRLVVPIPDLWLVLVAAVVGKALGLYLSQRPPAPGRFGSCLAAATAGYGILSLQLYISGAVLLPWLLPALTIWGYVLPKLMEGYRESR